MRNPFSGARRARPFEPAPQVEVDDELSFHLEQRIRDYVARGMDPAAARAAALERFGDVGGVRRECAELLEADRAAAARRDWFDDLRQDLRFGVRSALRTPLFSLLAIVTLALGIGANAAVFGVVKSVLLNALPYRDADRLVRVYSRMLDGSNDRASLSAGTVSDITERQRSFESVAAFIGPRESVLTETDQPVVVNVSFVEPGMFHTLGVAATLGRLVRQDDIVSDTVRVVMVTHEAWQRLFGGDPSVIGRSIRINGIGRTVAGVLPRGFVGPAGAADFYFPLDIRPALRNPVTARGSHGMGMIARLKPDVTLESAASELAALGADFAREDPHDNASLTLRGVALRDDLVGETRTPLLVLMASAGLVLVITCANLAGALLSRTISRRKEFAVRVALGAGRGRLVRQLLTESTLLALAGGAVGIALAMLGLAVLRGLATHALPAYADLSLDSGALLFAAALALLTGFGFGLAPAMSVSHSDTQSTLRDETRGTSESRRSRQLRGLLVAGQIALCVSLLAGAGLLARSLWAMTNTPLGFETEGVLTAGVQLPGATYSTPEAQRLFFERFEERLRSLPGVVSVADASGAPSNVQQSNGIAIVGEPPLVPQPFILYSSVSDQFFRAVGVPLKSGRTFGPEDNSDSTPTIIISEAMARKFWPRGGALGAQFRMGPDASSIPFTVVGIVGDVRNDPAHAEAAPMMYGPSRIDARPNRVVLLRTRGDPLALVQPLRRELAAMDPGVPLRKPTALHDLVGEKLTGRQLPVVLMSAFGVLALILASVGVYAMFAAMAAAREREFGVRMALGSTRAAIAGLVLRQGAIWMAVGLVIGAVGVTVISRFLRGLLYGVSQFDPVALGLAVLMLVAFGAVALLVPVRRATRVDPISVLR